MKNLSHYVQNIKLSTIKYTGFRPEDLGDLLAIPFFALSFYYFYTLEHKTTLENILMLFSLAGLILDCIFSAKFFL